MTWMFWMAGQREMRDHGAVVRRTLEDQRAVGIPLHDLIALAARKVGHGIHLRSCEVYITLHIPRTLGRVSTMYVCLPLGLARWMAAIKLSSSIDRLRCTPHMGWLHRIRAAWTDQWWWGNED